MKGRVRLREVRETDLPELYEHQIDPVATRMADFPSRDRETFMAHWRTKVLADPENVVRTIEYDGAVAGNIGSWRAGDERLVGYWIARAHWGKGIATRALAELLTIVTERPLHASVAKHNAGSIRVLEKCGFVRAGEDEGGYVMVLER